MAKEDLQKQRKQHARGLSMVKAVEKYINTVGYAQFPTLSPTVSIESIDPQDEFFHRNTRYLETAPKARQTQPVLRPKRYSVAIESRLHGLNFG